MASIYDFLPTEASNSTTGGVNAAEGMDPSAVNDASRAWKQLQARWLDDLGGVVTVGGTGDAQTVTLAEGMTALATGMVFGWKAPGTNTGAATAALTNSAPTLLGTPKIRRKGDTACSAGDMISGGFYLFRYDATADAGNGALILLNPEAAVTFATNAQAVTGTSTVLSLNPANLAAVVKLAIGNMPTIANNGTDAANDIDFSAGYAADINATVGPYLAACAALTKQLDANWAAGTNQGMRYSGAAIANTTYHLWAVWKDDGTQDYYADPSAVYATVLGHLQAETGGAAYTHMRRIGSIVRASAAILGFVQYGDEFFLKSSILDINANAPGTSAVTRTLTVPVGIRVKAIITSQAENGGTTQTAYLSSLDVTDEAPSLSTILAQSSSETSNYGVMYLSVWTNTSAQIRSRVETSSASADLRIRTWGWLDMRGRI